MNKQSFPAVQYRQPRYLVQHHGPNRHQRRAQKHQKLLMPESWWKVVNQVFRKVAR